MSIADPVGLLVLSKGEVKGLDDPATSSAVDIVAVHGLNGHREKTWTHKNNVMWLEDLIPTKIPGARIMTFGYSLGNEGISVAEIRKTATELLDGLCYERESEGQRGRPLVWIGHNIGGIIIKEALSIASNKRTYSGIAAGTSLLVVDKHSATLDVPGEEQLGLELDHHEMCQFHSQDDRGFKLVYEKMRNASAPDKAYFQCLRSLWAMNCESHLQGVSAPDVATLRWVEKNDAYSLWLTSTKPSILQIYGQPGSGISVLASFLSENVKASGSAATITRFSFDITDDRRNSTYSMFISLICQLLTYNPSLFHASRHLYKLIAEETNWTIEIIWAFFRLIFTYPRDSTTICIIDSIEECSLARRQFLENFLALTESTTANFKIIVTSSIVNTLLPVSYTTINLVVEAGARHDAEHVISSEISNLITRRPTFREFEVELQRKLLSLDSTILTAALALKRLEVTYLRSTSSAIRAKLKSLPHTLLGLYNCFLDDIPRETFEWAPKALSWIIRAFRPLKVDELAVALALEPDCQSVTNIQDEIPHDLARDLKHAFGDLIKIQNDEILLVHKSANSIFAGGHEGPCQNPCMLHFANHADISQACLKYLSTLDLPGVAYNGDEREVDIPPLGYYGLLKYAVMYWPAHYRLADDKSSLLESVTSFFTDGGRMRPWSELYWCFGDPVTRRDLCFGDPLPVAAELGLNDIVTWLWKTTSSDDNYRSMALDVAAERGDDVLVGQILKAGANITNALHLAARNGHLKVVSRLLANGATARALDSAKSSPLHMAAQSGYSNVAAELLQANSDVRATNVDGSTPLHLAAQFGHADVVDMLLGFDADVGSVDINKSTPMHLAVESGQLEVVIKLLGANVQVDAVDNNMSTPLHIAAAAGHVKIVQAMLNKDANVNISNFDGQTPLHLAVIAGNLPVVEELSKVADLNLTNSMGSTPLHIAASNGYADVARKLIEAGSPREPDTTEDESTPLHLAAVRGHWHVVEVLIAAGASVNVFDRSGFTPLHHAANHGFLEIVKTLLTTEKQAINLCNMRGSTPLHLAAGSGRTEVVETLIEAGSYINIAEFHGNTPLHLASSAGHINVVNVLLDATAEADVVNEDDNTPLHLAAREGRTEVVERLLHTVGVEPDVVNEREDTPLHLAARGGYVEVVELLMNYSKAELRAVNEDEETPLHLAARGGYVEVVAMLLLHSRGEVYATNENGDMPLHLASRKGHAAVVKQLLEAGASVSVPNHNKLTPLQLANQEGYEEIAKELLGACTDLKPVHSESHSALYFAIAEGDTEMVKRALSAGLNVNAVDKQGRTLLHSAAEGRNLEVVKILLGTDLDAGAVDNKGRTSLHIAAESGHLETVEAFLAAGLNPKAKDIQGRTVLHFAAERGRLEVVDKLLGLGVDVDAVDIENVTPLYLATVGDYLEVVKALLAFEAKPNIAPKDGAPPLYKAAYFGHLAIVAELADHRGDVDTVGPGGWRPLHAAYDSPDIVKRLLLAGAQVDAVSRSGQTALFVAADYRYEETIRVLLEAGANPLVADEDGNTPLHAACEWCPEGIARLMLKHTGARVDVRNKAGYTPLRKAVELGQTEVVNVFLELDGIDVDEQDPNGQTLLICAALNGHKEVTKLLLDKCNGTILHGDHLLRLACFSGDIETVDFLLRTGVEQNEPDEHGWTPQLFASAMGRKEVLELLSAKRESTDESHTTAVKALSPTSWSETDRSSILELGENDLTVRYPAWDGSRDVPVCAIRANHPVPPDAGNFYFEIHILDGGDNRTIGIGFCDATARLDMQPGWLPQSWGYHGDDGNIYHTSGWGDTYADGFGTGDRVGCNINLDDGTAFFTRNGKNLGIAFTGISGRLFPMVGMHCRNAHVRVNFGDQPFEYYVSQQDGSSNKAAEVASIISL